MNRGLLNRSVPIRLWAVSLVLLLAAGCAKDACDACAQDGGVSLEVAGPDGEDERVVLFDGWRAGRCELGLVCVGAPDVALGDVRWDLGCPSQMVTFASGFAPTEVEPPAAGSAPSVTMRPLVQLPIAVWVVASEGGQAMEDAVEEAEGDVREANRVFSLFGVGIELTYDGPDAIRRIGADTREGQDLQLGCWESESILNPSRAPRVFVPDRLNVYFIPDATFWGESGESCESEAGSLVFVRLTKDIYGTLAHEIGHALGIKKPNNGHSNVIPGFGPSVGNLMAMGVTEVTGVTIGQAFRMHFDPEGWLQQQQQQLVPKLIDQPCGDNAYARSPCPPVNLTPVRSWP